MKPRNRNRTPFVVIVLGLVGLLLAGCSERLVLGRADFLTFLAAGKVTSPLVVTVVGSKAGLGGTDATVTAFGEVTDPAAIHNSLNDLAASKLRLKTLPTTELTAAALTTGPIAPGFYHLSGNVTVPAHSTIDLSANGVYVFNIDGDLTLGDDVSVNAAFSITTSGAGNVFWNVGGKAQVGSAGLFSGALLATGKISVGPNLTGIGKLQSLTSDVALQSGTFLDGSGVLSPYLRVPQEVNAIAGQPLSLHVTAGVSTVDEPVTAPLVVSVKNLPAGAVVGANLGGVDTSGPNDSDVLLVGQDDTDDTEADLSTDLFWTPTVPGVYQVLYFAQTNSVPDDSGGGDSAEALADGTIDLAIVTIRVFEPVSTVTSATGSGSFGQGLSSGTFSVGVQARKAGPRTAQGTVTFAYRGAGLVGRSETIKAIVGSVPAPGQKLATVYGTARVTPYGVVPFVAQYLDSGRTSVLDQTSVTLYVDLDRNGTPDPISFGGSVPRNAGTIVVQ